MGVRLAQSSLHFRFHFVQLHGKRCEMIILTPKRDTEREREREKSNQSQSIHFTSPVPIRLLLVQSRHSLISFELVARNWLLCCIYFHRPTVDGRCSNYPTTKNNNQNKF